MESHGDADRLILQRPEDIDLKRIDAIIAGGGVGEDAVRMLMRNDLLGPGRFGKMFPDLEAFRPPDETLENLGLEMREPAPRDP